MTVAYSSLPEWTGARKFTSCMTTLFMLAILATLAACGGGAETTTDDGLVTAVCDPSDPSTFAECGTVMIALTDADGDFLNYTVDVLSLKLETADGRIIETLPRTTRINFTDYVDLAELVVTASIPPAIYVSGSISIDYSDAEVFVESGGDAVAAVVTNIAGDALSQTDLRIILSNRDQLIISRGRASLLQLDFDLDASHTVDISTIPATAIAEQFIIAEVTPVDEKEIRVRGPLISVSEEAMTYSIAIRPFHDRDGDFGRMLVHVTNDTEFEVNEVSFGGAEGLHVLSAAGQGTPTIAQGVLNVAEGEFTANIVLAGSSVPGIDSDAVAGNVISRDDNFLTVRGATIIASDRRAHFHDDVIVEVGPDTKVFKDGDRVSDLSIDAISIGQRVTVRGTLVSAVTDANSPQVIFDATQGAVRMHLTHLSGIVNTVMPGQTDITLYAIDRRRAGIFDFTGTGPTTLEDADPDDYEVATGNLTLADFAAGKPIIVRGFTNAFGTAPLDFTGRTVVDYTDVRSALGVGWGVAGAVAPFLTVSSEGLLLDNQNAAIDQRHHVKQGPVLIDLTTLDSSTTIVPFEAERTLFYIKSGDSLRMYSDFVEFSDDLMMSLNGTTTARSMHARGQYDTDTNMFTAYKIGVYLLEP